MNWLRIYSPFDYIKLIAVALLYVLLTKISFTFFSVNGIVSIIWPASGLSLAVLLIGGKKYWPAIFIGAFIADITGAISSALVSFFTASGPVLGALTAFWLLNRSQHFNSNLTKPHDFLRLGIAGALGSSAGAVIGVTTILLAGLIPKEAFAPNLLEWWQGDYLGIILLTPLLLVWRSLPHGWFARNRIFETVACFGLAFFAGQVIFIGWYSEFFGITARGFWMFVFVAWAGVRFGCHGALLVIAMTAIQMLMGMVLHVGGAATNQVPIGLLNFWFYILALTLVGIALGTLLEARNRLLAERAVRIRYLDAMARVNQVSADAQTADEMLDGVLKEVLDIFDADRAWFLYPCDPEATSWHIPMERTRPEWPGAHAAGQAIPMFPEAKELFERLLATNECVQYGPMATLPVPPQAGKQFAIKSQLAIALRPKTGIAWAIGLHHCSKACFYDKDDQSILENIAQRVRDSLSSFAAGKERLELENKFHGLFENSPIGLFHSLPSGKLLAVNPAFATMLRYASPEEMITTIEDAGAQIHVDPKKRAQLVEATLKEDVWVEDEIALRCKDDSIITASVIVHRVLDTMGTIAYLEGFVQDITEHKKLNLILLDSERRLRFLNELNDATRKLSDADEILTITTHLLGSHLGVSRCVHADINDDGVGFTVSQGYPDGCKSMVGSYQLSSLFGSYVASELHAGRTVAIHNVDLDLPLDENKEMYQAIELKAFIAYPLIRHGALRAIMSVHRTTPHTWTSYEISLVEEVAALSWVIIESTLAEKERNRLANIIEHSMNEIYLFDAGTLLFTYVNEGARENLGYRMESLITMTPVDIKPEFDETTFRLMLEPLLTNKKETYTFETMHRRADGTDYPVEVHLQLASVTDRPQFLAVIQDITERKQIENELQITQAAIENSQNAFFRMNSAGRVLYANEYACQSLGYTKEELLGMHVWEFDPSFAQEGWEPLWKGLLQTKAIRIETHYQHKDGTMFPVEVICNVISFDDEDYGFVFVQDTSARKASEESLRLAASVYDASAEGIMITDADNRIIAVNPAFTEITGYTADDVLGKDSRLLQSGRHNKKFYESMWQDIASTGRWHGEVWDKRKNGEIQLKRLTINTVLNDDDTVERRVTVFSDITEQKESEKLIWHQANFDALTELPNRQMFHDRLDQDIKKANRGGRPLALMLLDLDRFKDVNDSLGHDKGDLLLKEVSNRLAGCVRESDTVARLGGDEFTILLGDLGEPGSVERVANSVLKRLSEPFKLKGEVAYITGSIGITLYPDDATDIETLFKNADQAMYAAKKQGRNRYSYFTASMQEAVHSRMQMANDLRSALAQKQFWVAYQPIVELATGDIHKAEVLLRWEHPTHGLINPNVFIPIAEDTGLIIDIGDWVFRAAAQQAKRWRKSLHPAFQISVNKSPVQFYNDSRSHLAWYDHLRKLGLPGQSVTVEITEGLLLDANALVVERLLEFRDAGIEVSIDDFGTGYSSLSYLKKFSIDYLKIDQSFTRNLSPGSNDLALCEAMIVMAHALGIRVIAEGVETEEQKALLSTAGCDYAQGYLYAKPMKAEEFEKWMKKT